MQINEICFNNNKVCFICSQQYAYKCHFNHEFTILDFLIKNFNKNVKYPFLIEIKLIVIRFKLF